MIGERTVSPSRGGAAAIMAGGGLLALLAIVLLAARASAAPPSAFIAAPPNGTSWDPGQTIVFSANGSFDPEGNTSLYFRWNFSGALIEGPSAGVVFWNNFTTPGNETVALTVIDNESLEGYANVTVHIRPPNQPPVAFVGAPANGSHYFTDQFVNFSATGSYDPEGGPLAYFWSTNRSGQFGTSENLSVRLSAGAHLITLRVDDDRAARTTATIELVIEVNAPPRLDTVTVSPTTGFEGGLFTFAASYVEENGEWPSSVLLILDGSPHPMALASGSDPRAGLAFTVALALGPGRHSHYVLAGDGNLTNISATATGPDVWSLARQDSADGLANVSFEALQPDNLTLVAFVGPLPPDPPGLISVSAAYRADADFLAASNFSASVAFAPTAGVNRTSALLHRLSENGSEWVALVTSVDSAGNVATLPEGPVDLPATFRVFARAVVAPPNAGPRPVLTWSGETFPNATVVFDGANSTDAEGATVVLAWRFEGPGLSTDWIPGARVRVAFPTAGLYTVSLRAEDGSGNVVYDNATLEVREQTPVVRDTMQEAWALAGLAVAVVAAGALSRWWRGLHPLKKTYEDLYGRAYKQRLNEELEYAQLFERYAAPQGEGEPPVGDAQDLDENENA